METLTIEERCTLAYKFWTGICSTVVFACLREHGQDRIVELERRSINHHQAKHFLEGMRKLGLDNEPNDVIRCAKYHYFSNSLGGLPMDYVEESPERVWIRYLAPYWMGDSPVQPSSGPAVLGAEFGRAPYLGWHANNGAYLGNDRLVFVQTQSLLDGDPWDAGYFTLHDRPLEPGHGYLRRIGEWGPRFEPARAPALPQADWPPERRLRALRNFAIDFTASRCSTLAEILGPENAARVIEHAFTVFLAQGWEALPRSVGIQKIESAIDAARYFAAVAEITGDAVDIDLTGDVPVIHQRTMRFWKGVPAPVPEIDQAMARAWSKTLNLHAQGLSCRLVQGESFGYRWIFEKGDTYE
ncbi:hypothetical protein NE850_00030 [Paraburkholderia sp. USG1]|uniref:hypothetical protein n=1 Tax=Paraburkholderia sp. USG1 TaxID=2952268 RepID=UPI0028589A39|nr:hypothetical protein [Paraburkholderia sp. USG1]MDR8394714.1 hypothetical protein [Paraburkholderia sp. USG1]